MTDLAGLLVLSLEQAVAAPYASCRLADAGARVIKVERTEGDFARGYDNLVNGESSYFLWLNRGKQSLCLDLKSQDDLALLDAIAAKADVFIQNLSPGAAERLGLGAAAMTKRYPKLIYCSISGYGQNGPLRRQKAYDMLIQAESGLAHVNGTPDEAARVGISICDIAAGITAYSAILEAILGRGQTGEGRSIEVSLFHSIADWMNVPYLQTRYGNRPPTRMGLRHPSIAPYGAYRCGDAKALLLAVQNEREWVKLCSDVLDDVALANDQRFSSNISRVKNASALDAIIAARFAALTRDQAIAILDGAGIAYGRLSDMDDLVNHPQRRLIKVATAAGEIEMLAPGVMAGADSFGAVPSLGEHNDWIRREFDPRRARTGMSAASQDPPLSKHQGR
jgi:crotonobetainyl-CoA:carnitine CoA-transferase CaiB-like acyl-CoA transferase